MQKLECSIKRWGNKVLQEAGIGDEWNRIEGTQRQVYRVVSYLEEMLCEVMLDPKELVEAHRSYNLSYQK